jgi:3-oxoacyl-[acyl-carrier-protein] synthase II
LSRRAVITGLGPITCAGTGHKALWESIHAGRSGISRITGFDTGELKAHCGGGNP